MGPNSDHESLSRPILTNKRFDWCTKNTKQVYDSCFEYATKVFSDRNFELELMNKISLTKEIKEKRIRDNFLKNEDLLNFKELLDFSWEYYMKYRKINDIEIEKSGTLVCAVANSNAKAKQYQPNVSADLCLGEFDDSKFKTPVK